MDLIDVNKKEVTLMKYIGPFSPRVPASDSETLTNIFISKGSQNLEKTNILIGDIKLSQQKLISGDENNDNKRSENLGIVIKSNMADRNRVGKMFTDVSASDQLKANLGMAGINKAVKQCTNLTGGLVDGNLASKSLHSLIASESNHLSSRILGMGGIKMAATQHLDHVTSMSGIKSDFPSSLANSRYSITSGLMDVHQNQRSGLSAANLGIKKADSDLHAVIMNSSKGLALLDTKKNIPTGGCALDAAGFDGDGKLNQDKVMIKVKSLNKGDTRIPLPAIFANCQFALDLSMNMSFSEKTNLRKAITGHGGIVSFIVTKKSTHVICGDPEKADLSYKCKMATKYGIPIIRVDYVRDCVDKGRLLNTDSYLLMGKTKAEELKLGKISASRQHKLEMKQKVRPLFNVKNVKMWTYGEKDCPVFDEKNYQIAKYAMFKKLDKSTETTTFCVLELHVVDFKVDGTSEHRFRVFCHHGALHDVEEGQAGNKEIRFAQTSEEVVAIYVHLYHEQMKPPQSMTLTFDLLSRHVGSQKFKQMMEEIGAECGVISPAVSGLVNYVWEEAVGNLQHNLRGPLASIKTEQIDKAEGILKQMREAVDEENTMRLFQLKDEFYKEIPYQQTVSISDINKAWISRTFDLCQLIRDLIAVSEATDWSARPSDEAKYSALRCSIEHLESTSPEFKTIKDYLMQSLEGGMSLKVERIFHVHRSAESANFRMDLEPRRLLFHSSRVDNFMGILSRGLLMPRVVVDDHGGKRTDPGMLGSGIYFAEAGSTSAGYSSPGKTKGTRLMLINEVALGSCFGTTKHDKSLTEPPEGYQSVHGIKATENCPSDFKVDEYVVYNTNQQKIKYLVEFTLPGDIVTAHDVGSVLQNQQLFVGRMDTDEVEDLSLKEVDLKDVASVLDPISKVKAGLVSSGDAPVDLKRVHISAQLLDMVSQVVVIQEYNNNSSSPLEAKYVFPLDEMAAICGFEAFINGKHIIGEVKEKETAHKEYKKAISEGHGAYLMDQDEETPDVFTISVGNLPPWATVFIKITYVAELQVEDELISFRLPGSVAPWSKEAALQDKTQSDLATVEVKQGRTSLLVAVEMPFDIRTIECPTHKVKLKKTLTKAVVELCDEQSLSDGFQLLIGLAEIHVPRMWVERKDIDSDHQACMLSFYPEFEASEDEESDVIFLLDLSNSMKGAALTQAKKVLLLTLTHIPKQWTFNVIVFGTGYRELFPGGVCKSPENVKKVEKFVQGLKADMGNTEALRPLHSLHLLKQESSLRNVFLITDGHVNNEETTLAEIHCHCQNTRIFTFGVSSTANRHLLRALARMGGGAFEFFDPKSKSKWEGKVKSQISKAGHIGLTSISVHWEQYNSDVAAPVQAPQNINAIFSGSRQVIYGFVPNCTMATLKAQIDGQEVSTVVSTSDLNITEGKILHRLTARAIIRDWEDGLLSLDRADQEIMKATTKNMIIELSKEYSIVTQFTSFVAIEKRDEDKEVDESDLLDMNDLIGREAGDILQSMGYLSSSSSSSSSSDEVESLGELCWKSEDVMCENYVESEGINDDFCEDEWGGGGGGGGGGEMTSPLASMPRTLSREVEVMCADSHESYEYEDIFNDGDEGGMLRTFSREVMSAETVEYKDRRGEGKVDSIGMKKFMKIPRAKAMVDMSVDDSATVDSSIESDAIVVQCAVQEDSCEDMSFGLFGDADTITPSAQTSAKDEITPDSFTRMPSSSIPRTYAKIMSRKGTRDTAFMSRGGESANEETFDVNIKEKQPRESLMTKMSQVSSTRMSPTSFPMTDSLNETQEGPTAESVQEQVQEEKKASSPVQPELYIVRGYMQSKPRGILRKKGTKSAAETSGVARPLPLASSLVQPELDMSWRPEKEPMFEITGSICGRSAFETQGLARQTDHIFSNSGPARLSSAKYSERAQIKMSKKEGEAVHPRSASPATYRPLDMRVDSKLDFPGKKETPQVGTLFESVALAPPEIQSKSLFESAPSESHVLSEGHDISQQPMFRFGASKSSTLTASFASQQMFPSPAAFGSAAPKSSSLFGSGSSKKLSQNEPMHGFGAYTSSSLPDQFSSWQMFPSQEAVGFAVPLSSVPFGSQSSEKISPKELEHGFEAPTSSWSLTSLPVTANGSFFKLDASQPSQSVPQSHITFGSSSFAPAGQVIGHPSQSVPQSHITFGSPSFAPAGQVTGHPSQSVPQSHITFGSSSFAPAGQVTGQPSQSVPQSHFMFGSSSFTPTGQVTGQPVCQGHSSFGSASFTTTGPVTSHPSQQMFQSLSADIFKSFEPTGPVTSHPVLQSHPTFGRVPDQPSHPMLQSHPPFGFASFAPTLSVASLPSQQKFEKQSGFKCLEEKETLSAPFRSQMKVESGSLFGSSSFRVAQGKFKEPQPQPQPSVLQPLLPSPPAHRICSSLISSALAPEQYVTHMEKEMMVSPVLEQRQQPPPLPRRNKTLFHLAKSTPTPIQSALNILDVQKAPPPPPPPPPPPSLPALARNMCSFSNLEQRQQPPPLPQRNKTLFHLAKPTPTPIQSALNILDVQKAPPPPPPPPSLPALARNMCSFPNLEQQLQLDRMREEQVMKSSEVQVEQNRRLREKENRRHHEEEEQSCKSLISTSPQVSWRSYSVSAFRDTRNIYQKSEVAESMGAFERIQSRSLARMEHEPLLDSLDTMEESLLIEGGMLGEPVTTDLGHYGIGLNVECIAVRPMKGLPSSTVECIMKFQKEDGHWEFDADLERILGVDKNLCLHILYTSGLKSMGESAVQAIIQLATTLIVLLSIYKHLFPSSHLINLRQVDEQNNMYNRIRTAMSKLGFGHQFDNAMAYCNRMKRQHSLVPATLELGKSWEEMVGKMLGIHCDKSDIKRQSDIISV